MPNTFLTRKIVNLLPPTQKEPGKFVFRQRQDTGQSYLQLNLFLQQLAEAIDACLEELDIHINGTFPIILGLFATVDLPAPGEWYGALVYDTTTGEVKISDGGSWNVLTGGGGGGGLTHPQVLARGLGA
jgi:hypothetical protein